MYKCVLAPFAALLDSFLTTRRSIGDMAWIMAASAIVVLFVPALGFLYAGLLRKKNALSMLMLCLSVYVSSFLCPSLATNDSFAVSPSGSFSGRP